jgi:hypothetical protein
MQAPRFLSRTELFFQLNQKLLGAGTVRHIRKRLMHRNKHHH